MKPFWIVIYIVNQIWCRLTIKCSLCRILWLIFSIDIFLLVQFFSVSGMLPDLPVLVIENVGFLCYRCYFRYTMYILYVQWVLNLVVRDINSSCVVVCLVFFLYVFHCSFFCFGFVRESVVDCQWWRTTFGFG